VFIPDFFDFADYSYNHSFEFFGISLTSLTLEFIFVGFLTFEVSGCLGFKKIFKFFMYFCLGTYASGTKSWV
jgi:hypothetical protein